MTYLLKWIATDTEKSLKAFAAFKGNMQDMVTKLSAGAVKVTQSWHLLGEPQGFLIAKTDDFVALQRLAIGAAGNGLEVTATPIITDAEAIKATAATGGK